MRILMMMLWMKVRWIDFPSFCKNGLAATRAITIQPTNQPIQPNPWLGTVFLIFFHGNHNQPVSHSVRQSETQLYHQHQKQNQSISHISTKKQRKQEAEAKSTGKQQTV
jgi:hypothetical protein